MRRNLTTKEKLHSLFRVTTSGLAIFTGVSIYTGNEKFYDSVLMPVVRTIDPEKANKLSLWATKLGFVPPRTYEDPVRLKTTVWGLDFSNPLGMAAGFDKHGEAVSGLDKIGFGFLEVRSTTPVPQDGTPKSEVFRLSEDGAVINRDGFNSEGHEVVYERLRDVKNGREFTGIIGVNLVKDKAAVDHVKDYIDGVKKFGEITDYFVINISSPNTPGLRALQDKEKLVDSITKINEAREGLPKKPPLLIQLAPDLNDQDRQDLADIINSSKCKIDGLVISNTNIDRPNLKRSEKNEIRGLIGAPLTDPSTAMIGDMYHRTYGKIPIIGVGEIFSGADAYEKIKAGACLVQIYTSRVHHGPLIVNRMKKELDDLLVKDGYRSVENAVGAACEHDS